MSDKDLASKMGGDLKAKKRGDLMGEELLRKSSFILAYRSYSFCGSREGV